MTKLFGTDGVRGVANADLTAGLAFCLGHAGARVLAGRANRKPKIIIGRDTRISCDMLEAAIVAGICSTGADAVTVGTVPTPAVAYLTSYYKADAGVVISASHNSFEFNGIKFFNGGGYKLHDSIEEEIESLINAEPGGAEKYSLPVGAGVGRHSRAANAKTDYVNHLTAAAGGGLSGVRIALDCANGAASDIAPGLFKSLGAKTFVINDKPDGVNINDKCGSTHPAAIREFSVGCAADIGFAFDGDADRVIAVDEKGGIIDGDALLALLAIDMNKRGALAKNTVVATVMSNIGLERAVGKHGIKLVRTDVGDRYVLDEMLRNGYSLGGENSGHIVCLDENTTGDGMFAALRLLKILYGGNRGARTPVSELAGIVKPVPQIIVNAKVSNAKKNAYLDDPVIRGRCGEIESIFSGGGRVLIRPSGTEPLVRVMIESDDTELMRAKAGELAELIESRLG